ncbi:MAG: phage terminase large subunit family protein [gamma proteobacterium symbiont of Taylorina sp.]|nr:phage terminase large subunit family protein [gamma proteobacterium symbiont of Taylorina sp.]
MKYQEPINKRAKTALGILETVEPMRLSEWMEEYFYLSPESSSVEGAWENIPYQVGIMDCISNDDIEVVTWRKSARTGYTKIIVGAAGYFAQHKKRGVVIWQPTDGDVKSFVKDEINPMTRDVSVIRDIFPWYDKKSENNTINKKSFIGSTLDILGGTSPKNFRRLTKDVAVYDELAAFDADIGGSSDGEGDATSLGDVRLTTSSFPKSIRGSSPKNEESCQITKSLEDADLILYYKVPCPLCNTMQVLKWGGSKAKFGMRWTDGDPDSAHYCCESCKGSFTYDLLPEMLDEGSWYSEDGSIKLEKDGSFYQEGKVIDPPYHVGFDRLWAGYSVFLSWVKLVKEYLKALEKSKSGNVSKLKTFVNTRLGETWQTDVGEKIDNTSLYARREHYEAELPEGVLYLTAGVDTQDDRFEFLVVGWGDNEESWAIDYVRLYGVLSEDGIWDVLAEKLRKTYKRKDGIELSIETICHDSGGHFPDGVSNFSKKNGLFWSVPIFGSSHAGKTIINFPRKKNKKGVYLTEIGTISAKDVIYNRLKILEPGLGYCHFPVKDEFNETFFEELVVEKKTLSYTRGKRVFIYDCPNGRRNEPLDCFVYALSALTIAKEVKGVDLNQLAETFNKPKPVKQENKPPQNNSFINSKENWIK